MTFRNTHILFVLLLLQCLLDIAVFADLPIARQALGYLYLTFVPGLLLVKLLRIHELDRGEMILFSAGLSIAFLMLVGLVINQFSAIPGIGNPLSLLPVTATLNFVLLSVAAVVCLRQKKLNMSLKISSRKSYSLSLILAMLPVLSILGAFLVNLSGNNLLLLLLIVSIAILIAVLISIKAGAGLMSHKWYGLIIVIIAISLLFHSSLISNFVQGHDIQLEYFVAKSTQNQARWDVDLSYNQLELSRLNSMLSVTILPDLYSLMLNMDITWVFKILYPLIFSLAPFGLFKLWKRMMDGRIAFFAAFLLMSELTFHSEMLALARQMIAELFFVLLLILLLGGKYKTVGGKICFVIFSFSLVVSHYALAVVFMFFVAIGLLYLFLSKKHSNKLKPDALLLFGAVLFLWYIYTSGAASFNALLSYGDYVYGGLGDFLNPSSRGGAVLRGVGLEAAESSLQLASRFFGYATELLIVVGMIVLITRRTKDKGISEEYRVFALVAMILLIMCIVLPNFASTLRVERFYHISLFLLAPLFVIGAETVAILFSKRRTATLTSVLLFAVLLPYFLFQTGFVYEVTHVTSYSVPLSKYRMNEVSLIKGGNFGPLDVAGAQWLYNSVDYRETTVYGDSASGAHVLAGYGMLERGSAMELSNVTSLTSGAVVFLGRLNVIDEVVTGQYDWNTTGVLSRFSDLNTIYNNGDSEILKSAR